ncbi:arylsulfate sulfotransferase [Salinibacillus kushneri]|uniref:Arylsulfate sulfotransferase n=1 Tax=Salinibacillus kushneri TaxID=237682 RepID=A0A1H9ZFP1_9BACI|nr:aryl-sulfate sulfotransferase [Salinibacillus kushneri]SES80352.1 arylsulfate sulfotransferase [Salinibacillus kushneri]
MKKVLTIFVSIVILAGIVFFVMNRMDTNPANQPLTAEEYDYSPTIASSLLEEQNQLEEEIFQESEGSTFADPYVKVDPYNRSPLSALAIFKTEEPAQVSITVEGKTEDADISNTFEGYKTNHEIPILGLYPDAENTVQLTVTTESGETSEQKLNLKTEPLPDNIPTISVKEAKKEKMDLGETTLTFAIPSTKHPYGFDTNGDIRWYGAGYNSHVLKELKNGNLLYLGKDSNGGNAYNRLFETNFIGKLVNAFKISEEAAQAESEGMESTLIHHDVAELPSGNLLLTVNDGQGSYIEDTMIEIDRETGEVMNLIDLKDIVPEELYREYDSTPKKDGLTDWFHQNSVVYDESDNSIIISGRNQDTVMKIDYETNEIKWILSDSEGWTGKYEDLLVEGIGEDFKYTGGQHDATIMPDFDNNPDTIDLLIYDNNTVVTRGNEDLSKDFSAGTQYRINEKEKTAEIVWSYGKERGEELFTNIVGSAKYLDDTGNRLIGFGHVDKGNRSHIVEVTDDQEAEVVFEAVVSEFPTGAWVYRGVRYELY